MGRIPYTAVKEYADSHDLDEEQKEGFFLVIERLDYHELIERSKRMTKGAKGGKNRRP